MKISPTHFNNNLFCAIDIETTGLTPGYHDIRELAIIPIATNFTMDKSRPYFHALFRPKYNHVDEDACSRADIVQMRLHGMNPDTIQTRLRDWFEKQNLVPGKKIVPLGANYANFDRNFLVDWLGGELSYSEFFRSDSRDVQQMALMINDLADWNREKIPFPKVNLQYLANCVNYTPDKFHTAIEDCRTTIEVYRRMMAYKHYVDMNNIGL